MKKQSVRLGVDIGGTFTDVVLEVDGVAFSAKVLTTYVAPENAIIDGLHQVCAKGGVRPSQIDQIIHGTTLATNALIERRGAKTALITTEGFRDVIEMRTESRFEQYDLNLTLPEPLLPRQMRYTVPGRMDASGNELIGLTRAQIAPVVDKIAATGYASVAVGLIHSYLNDAHEKLVRDVLADKIPNAMVSLSCEVSPQMREYERFNTVVANAYIKPLMKSYLGRLEGRLREEGVDCSIFLMHSGGGIISLKNAAEFPVRLVESGPAGGAVFAANIAARYGLDKVLSFDMGGTTAKICLIKDQTPKTSRVFEVARTYRFKKGSGMPISIPVIDMVEIGAGGGSLAHVDAMRQIRVGPESAGSEPGPACYGRGGDKPAVTDADLVLGKLDPDNFAGGTIKLDLEASANALSTVLGDMLDMDATTSAFGLAEVVDENMANAARVHAVENGEDLSEYTMIAFGGAAPLHAGRLCEKLGVDRLLVPPGAGVGSAIGFLRAPFSFEANRSVYMTLESFDSIKIKDLLVDLQVESTGFVRNCDAISPIISEFKVYMRYSGQGWEIPIALTEDQAMNPDVAVFERRFIEDYTKLFGRPVAGMDIEITVWSVNATTPPEPVDRVSETASAGPASVQGTRQLFDPAIAAFVDANVVLRHDMDVGATAAGPAIITEDETTLIVPSSRSALRQPDGCLDMRKTTRVKG
jgi:N-methylhydantoinase A